jgi:hypothetical protein
VGKNVRTPKSAVLVKMSGPEPTCRRKAKICSDMGSKIRIFSGPRSREGRIFRDIFCGVIISILSRVKIRAQHVLGLQYVFSLHKFPVDYDPPYPECTDNSTDLSGVPPNFCSDCNRPHGNFGSKFVRTPEPTSPLIFGGPPFGSLAIQAPAPHLPPRTKPCPQGSWKMTSTRAPPR